MGRALIVATILFLSACADNPRPKIIPEPVVVEEPCVRLFVSPKTRSGFIPLRAGFTAIVAEHNHHRKIRVEWPSGGYELSLDGENGRRMHARNFIIDTPGRAEIRAIIYGSSGRVLSTVIVPLLLVDPREELGVW